MGVLPDGCLLRFTRWLSFQAMVSIQDEYPESDAGGDDICPDNKVHGANMGPTWVLSAPGGPHVGPMNLARRVSETEKSFVQNISFSCQILHRTRQWYYHALCSDPSAPPLHRNQSQYPFCSLSQSHALPFYHKNHPAPHLGIRPQWPHVLLPCRMQYCVVIGRAIGRG